MEITTPSASRKSANQANQMASSDSLHELEGLKRLESQVIGAVYDRYFTDVYRFVYYKLNDEQVAEDISSDVFVRLLEAIKRKRGPQTNLKGWLLATASHAVADHLRQAYRKPTKTLFESLQDDNALSLHEEVDRREQVKKVREAYVELTDDQQDVLALRFGNGYSLEETARVMQKNVNAVKALQFRALAALQRNIGDVAVE